MVRRLFRCIIMGPVGSGKGTISQRIISNFTIFHLPCGDYLRMEMNDRTPMGLEAKTYVDRGQLVPDSLAFNIIAPKLEQHKHENLLLDGFPRTVAQAMMLQTKCHVDTVIELNVPNEVIVDRLVHRWIHLSSGRIYNTTFNPPKNPGLDDITGEPLTQRDDDKSETVLKRLESYENWEKPLASYYEKLGVYRRFSGTETNKIWPEVYKYLHTFVDRKYLQKRKT